MKIYVDPVGYANLVQSEAEIPGPYTEIGGADAYALYRGADGKLYAVEMPGYNVKNPTGLTGGLVNIFCYATVSIHDFASA
ncbi:hypothetical protein [Caproiciproducens sp. CPB-2]|uniref:hypothetical protein n=1 Tax=Caproiciproducens sp. CPB-2 TaxID=3030017 RepID=UPI0023DC77EA|nr:hypothetical protein [Caproiciproducens sp. CPB-2]MDF1495232.1 hypothetical protein [Caproiciproducens sp. CPB-2]